MPTALNPALTSGLEPRFAPGASLETRCSICEGLSGRGLRGEHSPQQDTTSFPLSSPEQLQGRPAIAAACPGQSQVGTVLPSSTLSTEHTAGGFAAGIPEPYLPAV